MTRTILLVDDERDSLDPMRLLLESEYQVLTAESGKEALGLLEAGTAEVIIADQRMPGMTGVELLARVREFDPEIVRLILTAYTDFEAMLKAINEGQVYRYIIKPWDVDDMRLVIRQALEWRDLRQTSGQLSADLAGAHRALAQRTRELERAHGTIVQQEKLAAVGRFAAEMVHEMNNYLQIILGLNTSMTFAKETELKDLHELETQAKTLAEIAGDIRDFARGAALPFAAVLIDPRQPAEEVVRACAHHPAFRGIEVKLECGEMRSWRVDPRQLKHLLLNLLKNAAKASSAGDTLELRVEAGDDELRYLVIDHGLGIPPVRREQIWEPFYTTWDQNGTGLGLSICLQVVEMHGGRIACEETPGGGTTFRVQIPRKPD